MYSLPSRPLDVWTQPVHNSTTVSPRFPFHLTSLSTSLLYDFRLLHSLGLPSCLCSLAIASWAIIRLSFLLVFLVPYATIQLKLNDAIYSVEWYFFFFHDSLSIIYDSRSFFRRGDVGPPQPRYLPEGLASGISHLGRVDGMVAIGWDEAG